MVADSAFFDLGYCSIITIKCSDVLEPVSYVYIKTVPRSIVTNPIVFILPPTKHLSKHRMGELVFLSSRNHPHVQSTLYDTNRE